MNEDDDFLENLNIDDEIDFDEEFTTFQTKENKYTFQKIRNICLARMCELRNITWSQFVPEYFNGGLFLNVYSAKQKKKRNIAISPELSKLLLKLKNRQQNFCKKHNLPFDENEVKIISQCNSNLQLNKFNLVAVKELDNGFRNLLDRCKIEHYNYKVLYSFRHTYVTLMLEQDTPILDIAKQCGTSIKMIEEHYDQSSHLKNMALLFIKSPISDKK